MLLDKGERCQKIGEDLLKVITKQIEEVIEEEVAATQERIHKRISAQADQIALGVLSYYNARMMNDEVVITVKKELTDGED